MGKQSAPNAEFSGSPWAANGSHTVYNNPTLGAVGGSHQEAGGNPMDFGGAAQAQGASNQQVVNQQTQANRPNQNTPFASSGWTQGPDGQWTQNTSLNGGLGTAAQGLQGQIAGLGQPMDFSGLPQVGNGMDARNRAEDALYSRGASRLDPQFDQREQSMRTQLLNQGLDPGSEAYRTEMDTFGRQRNDAYAGLRNDSISGGGAEMSRQFGQEMQGRNQALSEMLTGRNQPMQELRGLQGFTQMPGFQGAGQAQATPWMQALQAFANYQLGKTSEDNQASGDFWGGLMNLAGAGATAGAYAARSDARVKKNIYRHAEEAMPGVPFATFEFIDEPGQRYRGVIAQDVERVRPDLVVEIRGIKCVPASLAAQRIP